MTHPAEVGRRFTTQRRIRLGDVDKGSQLRLDATARYLQDIATDDIADARLVEPFGWVVRRTTMVVRRPGTLDELVDLTTRCTGLGRSWAERSTSMVGDRGAAVDTVSLWVQIDPARGRPAALTSRFTDIYGPAANGRKVSPRLMMGSPPEHNQPIAWQVRSADLDPFDHVNNAAHWAFVEEMMSMWVVDRVGTFDVEFVDPITIDDRVAIQIDPESTGAAGRAWLVSDDGVHSAARWSSLHGG